MKARLFLFLLLAVSPRRASAAPTPTKEACISAFDQAQHYKRSGHLRDAREKLLVCSAQECPGVVRADCADVLKQVDAAQPTIVLKASDTRGADLTDVTVDLDGQRLVSSLDGRAIAVDPGKLALVFRRAPWPPVTVEVVIAEGEKGRIVATVLGPATKKEQPPSVASSPPKRSTIGWTVPIGLAVVGVGALAIGGVTRLNLGSEVDDRKTGPNACAPSCSQEDRDALSGDLVLANVMLGVGLGSIALAAISWFVLAPAPAPSTSTTARKVFTIATGRPLAW